VCPLGRAWPAAALSGWLFRAGSRNGTRLQDIIAQGLGTAARAIGVLCDAFRPSEGANPLASVNRFLQLSAAFNPRDPGFRNAGLPGNAVWYGVFDSAYLVPGDYLVEQVSGRIWFVAALQSLLPATCIHGGCCWGERLRRWHRLYGGRGGVPRKSAAWRELARARRDTGRRPHW
jgi:hypothetical protein